ncbi:hypothetical protein GOV12_04655 [Candidatus Pacearchaeota archaeon]|nr:hypothetical protein [Candidatus Pacearchaeota archaeon]
MVNNDEIQNVMGTVRKSYPRYKYDNRQGFLKGPTELEYNPGEKVKLASDEAVIGIIEPIPRMAKSVLIRVKRHDNTWKVEDVLREIGG